MTAIEEEELTTIQQEKLRWLIRVSKSSHYACEYRQDNNYRASVKCGGCHHSQQSANNAEQAVVDYVQSLIKSREAALTQQHEREIAHTQHLTRLHEHCITTGLLTTDELANLSPGTKQLLEERKAELQQQSNGGEV